jgi:hypothetical protein
MKVLALTLTLLLVGCSKKPYEISKPKDKKEHAIVQITNNGMSCTAFVISDDTAITAGHCVKTTQRYVEWLKGDGQVQLRKIKINLERTLNELDEECKGERTGITCGLLYAIIKAKLNEINKILASIKTIRPDHFILYGLYGKRIPTVAIAYSMELGVRDHAVLKGDFRNFEKIPVRDNKFEVKHGDLLRACGYAGAKHPPVCTDFTAWTCY